MSDNLTTRIWERPSGHTLTGKHVTLVPLDWAAHGEALAEHLTNPKHDHLWTYMSLGPFRELSDFRAEYDQARTKHDWITLTLLSTQTKRALGIMSYMRIRPQFGSVEVGFVLYSPSLQRTTAATEAIYLMSKHVFETLGYRRFEWKCDNANEASKRAAIRLGFQYEGLFRKDMVYKGRNRDTAWFSITDDEWPNVKAGFEKWLSPENFDIDGQQILPLSACR